MASFIDDDVPKPRLKLAANCAKLRGAAGVPCEAQLLKFLRCRLCVGAALACRAYFT